jgi:hypothetical protein
MSSMILASMAVGVGFFVFECCVGHWIAGRVFRFDSTAAE